MNYSDTILKEKVLPEYSELFEEELIQKIVEVGVYQEN